MNRFRRIQPESLNDAASFGGSPDDLPIVFDDRFMTEQRLRRIVNQSIPLGGIASRAGEPKIVIRQPLVGKTGSFVTTACFESV